MRYHFYILLYIYHYYLFSLIQMGKCVSQLPFICIDCKEIMPPNTNELHKCKVKVALKTVGGYVIVPNTKDKKKGVEKIKNQLLSYQLQVINTTEKIFVKTPKDQKNVHYQQNYEEVYKIKPQICQLSPLEIKFAPFQMKLIWFRTKLEEHRISWQEGCDTIKIDRQNILFSGIESLSKVNLHREIKIKFIGEQDVFDAGGLLRQWMHLSIKEIFSPELGLFELCNTQETAYKFVPSLNFELDLAKSALTILGIIIGKAIFEKIPLGCFLNRTILRSICGEKIRLEDTFNFDKDLYSSWLWISNNDNVEDLQKYFVEENIYKNGEDIELVEDGKKKLLTSQNKEQYLISAIDLYCNNVGSYFLDILKESIYKIIPSHLLYAFQPYQLDSILNGPSKIDTMDWKKNTVYEGYKQNDQIIKDFWSLVVKFDDFKLRNLLHYCTGITRVPIHGFSHLQSNRGEKKRFTIRKIQYEPNSQQLPKAYTCFNRLELPEYPDIQMLEQRLLAISSQEISYFGLD